MVSVRLVGLMAMLATGHCHEFIIAAEYTDKKCDGDDNTATPFFGFLHEGRNLAEKKEESPEKKNSAINYNYYANDVCTLSTVTYEVAHPKFTILKMPEDCPVDKGYEELTAEECASSANKPFQQEGTLEVVTLPAFGGNGTWRKSDEGCGCYAEVTDEGSPTVLYYNRYVITGRCKQDGVAYGNKKQKKLCKIVKKTGTSYARMRCHDKHVQLDVFEKDDKRCERDVIGIVKHERNQCKKRDDDFFSTYIRFTCGYRMQAMRLRAYSAGNCDDSTMTVDEVVPLGVCMTSFGSGNYFDVGQVKRHKDGTFPLPVRYNTFRFSRNSKDVHTTDVSQFRWMKMEEYIEESSSVQQLQKCFKNTETGDAKNLKLSCDKDCSTTAYEFLDGRKVHFKVEDPDSPYDCVSKDLPYTTILPDAHKVYKTAATTTTVATTAPPTAAPKLRCLPKCDKDDTFGWLRKCATWDDCNGCRQCTQGCAPVCKKDKKKSWNYKCTKETHCELCPQCHHCHSSCKPAQGDQTWWMCKKPWCKNCEPCIRDYARRYPVDPKEKADLSRMRSPSTGIAMAITVSALMGFLSLRLVRARNRAARDTEAVE